MTYCVIYLAKDKRTVEQQLNELGDVGFKLVTIINQPLKGNKGEEMSDYIAYFMQD
jgi:hypothetical protein